MEGGKLVAISYTSTDSRSFVQVTVQMAVTEYERDATGKIVSMSLGGLVGDCGNTYHVQPNQTNEEWASNGLLWKAGRMVQRPIPGSYGMACVWCAIAQGATDDGVIKDPEAWADRAIMGREEYNATIEAEQAREREECSTTTGGLDSILKGLVLGMDTHGNLYEL